MGIKFTDVLLVIILGGIIGLFAWAIVQYGSEQEAKRTKITSYETDYEEISWTLLRAKQNTIPPKTGDEVIVYLGSDVIFTGTVTYVGVHFNWDGFIVRDDNRNISRSFSRWDGEFDAFHTAEFTKVKRRIRSD